MDVGELLNFKPTAAPKRPLDGGGHDLMDHEDDPNESYEKRAAKRKKLKNAEQKRFEEERLSMLEAEAAAAMSSAKASTDPTSDELLSKLEAAAGDSGEANGELLDETKLKKMLTNFEKRILKNQELRIKFPDDPSKFMVSEVELHDAVQELRAVATVPDFYPLLVDLQCISSLLGLLSHENTDITVAVVDLLQVSFYD